MFILSTQLFSLFIYILHILIRNEELNIPNELVHVYLHS